MSAFISKTPLFLICFVCYSSCQRSVSAKENANASACYALLADDGFHDLICDGAPIKQRPGPEGPAGPKGSPGSPGLPGERGPAGEGLGFKSVLVCNFEFPTGNKTLITYSIFTLSDDKRIASLSVQIEAGPDKGIFSNSAFYAPESPLYNLAVLDTNEFEVKLVNAGQAYIRHRITTANYTFPCN